MYGVFGVATRGGVQRRARRGPRALCFSRWRLQGSQREVQIRWFHSVGRWIPLQRHYGVRSCMAVAWLVQGYLFFLFSLSVLDRILVATSRAGECCLSHQLGFARPALPSGVVLTAFRTGQGLSSSPRVDDPIQPGELCCIPRVDVPIQPGDSCFFFFLFVSWLWPSRIVDLHFSLLYQ